jgi:hypothetical protein
MVRASAYCKSWLMEFEIDSKMRSICPIRDGHLHGRRARAADDRGALWRGDGGRGNHGERTHGVDSAVAKRAVPRRYAR